MSKVVITNKNMCRWIFSFALLLLLFLNFSGTSYAACVAGSGGGGDAGAIGDNATAGCTGTAMGGGGGGGGGSRAGGNGTAGAGGGVMLKNTAGSMTISGTIDNRGGGSSTTNGGTVKLFYTGGAPTTTGVTTGRLYTAANSNAAPSVPTLLSPASGATGTSISPLFQFRSSDADNDYLRYKVLLYNSDCSTGLQTFDQTLSQVGWLSQDQQGATAYTGNFFLTSSTIASFGGSNLSASTQYCWKGAAIDPAGTNTFSAYSATQLFTTGAATGNVDIRGGTEIRGGTIVR